MAGKVLAGSMPATMPIERPSKFELILNRRTAEALGVTIPGSVEATSNRMSVRGQCLTNRSTSPMSGIGAEAELAGGRGARR